jgi:hypothetical protein
MPKRFLCSHLATVRVSGKVWTVLIEEIWRDGAILECEEEIPQAEFAELDCGGPFFAGKLNGSAQHEFGWRAEMKFSAETPWSEKKFRPSHLLDPSKVKGPEKK